MSDFKDIWKDDAESQGLSDEQLMAYLEGRLPEAERHAVEALLAGEGMESDAVEGLQALGPAEAQGMKRKVNAELQRTLGKKKLRRRGIGEQQWSLVAVMVVLVLLVVCYLVFFVMKL
jgi:anti-sigma factor RsiW